MTRRTQAQRRAETQGRLMDASVRCLAELGYAKTSVKAVCGRAGVSQGALFNYHPTRLHLIAATTDHICDALVQGFSRLDTADPEALVLGVRALARSERHAAWHDVMVAARTNPDLRERVRPTLARFEAALLEAAAGAFGVDTRQPQVAAVVLSLLHIFDSEAVTVAVLENPAVEAARVKWAVGLLKSLG